MLLTKNSKLVFIGDSITDCGRKQPVGEGLFEALGKGYVARVDALLQSTFPQLRIRTVNVGSSGNTTRDLRARWERDVLALAPDFLSIMIGINDVWRQFDTPLQADWGVGPEEYQATLDELCAKTAGSLRKLILVTPFYIEPNKKDAMRARMDQYGAIVRKLARRYDAVLVDTQAGFDAFLRHHHPNALAWDRVHPNETGHMIIARAWLNAIGYSWAP